MRNIFENEKIRLALPPETTDEYGQVLATKKNAKVIREIILQRGCVSIALALGNLTLLHVTFVDLMWSAPINGLYDSGSERGLQINIDRHGSYALPWELNHIDHYAMEKLGLHSESDQIPMAAFISHILSGEE